jgi:hypothetical protein
MEATAVADIREHGWHVVLVRGGVDDDGPWSDDPAVQAAYEALFTYTVGLTATFGHPELILVGEWQHAHPFLNAVGDLVKAGQRFRPGDTSEDVLDGFIVRFDAVGDACRTQLLTLADWAVRREPFEALQLVLPDTSGRWPEDPDYNGFPQPPLR